MEYKTTDEWNKILRDSHIEKQEVTDRVSNTDLEIIEKFVKVSEVYSKIEELQDDVKYALYLTLRCEFDEDFANDGVNPFK